MSLPLLVTLCTEKSLYSPKVLASRRIEAEPWESNQMTASQCKSRTTSEQRDLNNVDFKINLSYRAFLFIETMSSSQAQFIIQNWRKMKLLLPTKTNQ